MKNTKWIASGVFLVVCGVFVFFVVRDEGPRLRLGFKGFSRDEDTVWAVVTMRNEGSQAALVRGYRTNDPFYETQEWGGEKWGVPVTFSRCGIGAREWKIEPGSETQFKAYIWETNKWEGRFGVRYGRSSIWDKVPYEVKRFLPIFSQNQSAMAWTERIIFEPTQRDIAAAREREAKLDNEITSSIEEHLP
jgi:hypothetical protein